MSTYTLTVIQDGNIRTIPAEEEKSLLEALRNAGVTSLHTPCGGRGLCKQCGVAVTGRLRSVHGDAPAFDAAGTRHLACQSAPAGDCVLVLPEEKTAVILVAGAGDLPPGGEGLGVAVDIGTTTVAAFLYDLQSGRRLRVASGRNAQRPFGADVISRIQYSDGEGGLKRLADAIRGQLSGMVDDMCRAENRERSEIKRVAIAGNTVMEHIFAELSPVTIGVSPFTTLSLFGESLPAEPVFPGMAEDAEIYLCPALAGYVGGDITAGLLSSGASEEGALCLFMDIGTNGEMGLGDGDGYLCCATAAGPAFEGAEIEMGMDGTDGAIDKVYYVNHQVGIHVIGGVEARGICGSGLVDAVAVMLRCGAVTETGRMLKPQEAPEHIRDRLRPGADGKMRFFLTDRVCVSADDVRQIQLAKSAIRGGIETLMALKGNTYGDISEVLIAGGFGAYMDVKSAGAIGLLPPALIDRTRHVGNSAGAGAALALNDDRRRALRAFADKCAYTELSASAVFYEKYIECMPFDEVEEVYGD